MGKHKKSESCKANAANQKANAQSASVNDQTSQTPVGRSLNPEWRLEKDNIHKDKNEDEEWSSEDDVPETWESRAESREVLSKPNSAQKSTNEKEKMAPQEALKKAQEAQGKQKTKDHTEVIPDEEVNEQDVTTTENVTVSQTLKKLAKIDKAVMKSLMALVTGTGEQEAVLDRILTEFTRLKSITLEATHEVARLQGVVETYQKERREKPTYAEVARQEERLIGTSAAKDWEEEAREKKEKPKVALIVTSETLNTKEIQEIIKKNADPHELGVEDPEMRSGRKGVIITATSKQGLSNLEVLIKTDKELANKLTTTKPKEKLLQVKIVGIQEDISKEDLIKKIIKQNSLKCNPEHLKVNATWRGKQGTTAVIALHKAAWEGIKDRTHLNIGWTRCIIYDNTFVARCTNCARYGHTARWCQAKEVRCIECGGRHYYEECRSCEQECIACTEEGYLSEEARHSMMALDCPTFLKRKKKEKERIIQQLELAGE